MARIRVGLVGTGWWANDIHAPLHQNNDETELVGVWARNPEKTRAFADKFGIEAFDDFDEMLNHVDAVDFAVPPYVQTELAVRAAQAGKALILEKPLGERLADARRLVEAIEDNRVPHLVCFTNRYSTYARNFIVDTLDLAESGEILALQGRFVHGGMLGGGNIPSEGTWRNEHHGALLDLGPHALNLIMAAIGPIVAVRATSGPTAAVTAIHENGATSQTIFSGVSDLGGQSDFQLTVYGATGHTDFTHLDVDRNECWPTIHSEFVAAVREGAPVTVDAFEALDVQKVLEAAIISSENDGEEVRIDSL